MCQVEQLLIFAKIKMRQNGRKKLSWMCIWAWHDMRNSLFSMFSKYLKNDWNNVLNEKQICIKLNHLTFHSQFGWCVDSRDRKKYVMVQVEQLSFANNKIGQKGSKKLSWITILAWHDTHKMTASSLCFQSIFKNDLKIVLNEICTKTIWFFPLDLYAIW